MDDTFPTNNNMFAENMYNRRMHLKEKKQQQKEEQLEEQYNNVLKSWIISNGDIYEYSHEYSDDDELMEVMSFLYNFCINRSNNTYTLKFYANEKYPGAFHICFYVQKK